MGCRLLAVVGRPCFAAWIGETRRKRQSNAAKYLGTATTVDAELLLLWVVLKAEEVEQDEEVEKGEVVVEEASQQEAAL
jgi:hypothetical protein